MNMNGASKIAGAASSQWDCLDPLCWWILQLTSKNIKDVTQTADLQFLLKLL